MSLCDLPGEILSSIVGILCVRDVAALGATSHATHAIVADDAMWRVLFVRDFAGIYAEGLAAKPWPHPTHPDDPWHEFALELWEGTDAIERMPPRCPPVPHLPAPFAHAFGAGKDWLWLYKAHAIVNPDRAYTGPATRTGHFIAEIVRGDAFSHPFPRYHVTFALGSGDDDKTPVSWTEMAFDTANHRWHVHCTGWSVKHTVFSPMGHYSLTASRLAHERAWSTSDWMGMGQMVSVSPSGRRSDGTHKDGVPRHLVTRCIDGYIDCPMDKGLRCGVAHMFYSNGDVARLLFADDRFVDVKGFACSPLCPKREYAGRRIVGCRWRMETVILDGIATEVPVPIDDSEGARVFWSYVREGLVGWHPDIRRIILNTVAPL